MTVPALVVALLVAASAPVGAESFASWTLKAEKAQKRGDTAEAIEAYSSALRLWLKRDGAKAKARVLSARASIYEEEGEFEQALEDAEAALEADAKNARLLHARGRVLLKLGRTSDAITDFYKATKLDIRNKEVYFDRAEAYALQGDAKFALEDYKNACRLGHKGACDKVRPPKPAPKRRAADDGRAQGPKARRVKGGGLELVAAPVKASYKLDFKACLAGLEACLEEGTAFGACVKAAKLCERSPKKGCCPELCVKHYHRLVDAHGRGEATAFRETFTPGSACSKGRSVGSAQGVEVAAPPSEAPGSAEPEPQ